MYARACETEYETPLFDKGEHEPDSDNSPQSTVRHYLPFEEACTTPGTIQEDSPKIFPRTGEVGDGTDTDHYMEPDVEVNVQPLSPTDIKRRSTKYDLHHYPKPNCNDDYRY